MKPSTRIKEYAVQCKQAGECHAPPAHLYYGQHDDNGDDEQEAEHAAHELARLLLQLLGLLDCLCTALHVLHAARHLQAGRAGQGQVRARGKARGRA